MLLLPEHAPGFAENQSSWLPQPSDSLPTGRCPPAGRSLAHVFKAEPYRPMFLISIIKFRKHKSPNLNSNSEKRKLFLNLKIRNRNLRILKMKNHVFQNLKLKFEVPDLKMSISNFDSRFRFAESRFRFSRKCNLSEFRIPNQDQDSTHHHLDFEIQPRFELVNHFSISSCRENWISSSGWTSFQGSAIPISVAECAAGSRPHR